MQNGWATLSFSSNHFDHVSLLHEQKFCKDTSHGSRYIRYATKRLVSSSFVFSFLLFIYSSYSNSIFASKFSNRHSIMLAFSPRSLAFSSLFALQLALTLAAPLTTPFDVDARSPVRELCKTTILLSEAMLNHTLQPSPPQEVASVSSEGSMKLWSHLLVSYAQSVRVS